MFVKIEFDIGTYIAKIYDMEENNKPNTNIETNIIGNKNQYDAEISKMLRYLYDKEVERANIIASKAAAAIGLIGAEGLFLAYKNGVWFQNKNVSKGIIWFVVFLVALDVFAMLGALAFTTKINEDDYERDVAISNEYYKTCVLARVFWLIGHTFKRRKSGIDILDYQKLYWYNDYLHEMNNIKEQWLFITYLLAMVCLIFEIWLSI